MLQHCNMSHFEKFANFGMTCGVKKLNIGYIFYARKKSPHESLKNVILPDVMQGFFPSIKNVAAVWFFDTALFLWHVLFSQSRHASHNYKKYFEKKIKGFIYILSSSFPALFGSTFENFQKNHFLLHFGTFLKIKDFPRIFVWSNSIRQKWT